MLTAIRQFAKSWVAKVLMFLLAVSFVGWGVNSAGGSAVTGDQVIKAGSRKIGSPEFRREYDNYKKRLEQQSGQPITAEMAEANNLDSTVLNGVATREAFAEMMHKIGIAPSDKLVLAQIEKIPAFFDNITGKFDRKTFQERLGENGMTPEMFDTVLRDEMATQHWAVGVQNGLAVPRTYGALAAVFGMETRDLAFFTVKPDSVPQPAAPTDAQLQAFINENKQAFTVPELRQLSIAAFTAQAVAATVATIDPAELKKRYDFRKDTLSTPETRTVVQIPVKTPAAGQQVVARLGRGEAPEAIAKSLGVDAITFDNRPMTAISDRKTGQAAFKLMAGQVAVVPGDLGLSVVKVVSVSPGHEITMEQARPMLEAEIRKDMVAEKVYAQTQAFDDAHQGGANFADSAAKAGVKIQAIPVPISAQGVTAEGGQLQGFPPKILETAFALPSGGDSEVTELGDGAYFVVHVDKIVPAHVQGLAEARPRATQAYMQREIVKALEARATALSARLAKEPIEAVAASGGYVITRVPGLSRQTAQGHQEVGRDVLARAFSAKPGEGWYTRAPDGIAVGKVDNVRMDAGPTAARLAEANRGELTQTVFREIAEAAQVYSRTKLKVKVDPARARAAAGFEPIDPKKAGKAAPEKKG